MKSLHRLTDDEIMKYLLPQFGIGRWTVEMFLMFQLGRQDVWPVGDLGVRRGWERRNWKNWARNTLLIAAILLGTAGELTKFCSDYFLGSSTSATELIHQR